MIFTIKLERQTGRWGAHPASEASPSSPAPRPQVAGGSGALSGLALGIAGPLDASGSYDSGCLEPTQEVNPSRIGAPRDTGTHEKD
jgi:hypothetical protein